MTSKLTIRTAKPGDEQALSLVGSATFLETYAHMIPGSDLVTHCATKHSPETYAAWLREASTTIWLAETEIGAPVGYLVLTKATLPVEEPHPQDLEVQRVYVLDRFHDHGMGFALMNLAISKAVARGAERVVLGVHNENARALSFYKRQGFEPIDARRFHVGISVFCDTVLARKLR